MSAFASHRQGDKVRTSSGGTLTFIAYVPQAKPGHQVIALDGEDLLTFWADGRFCLDREPSGLDLIPNQEQP